MSKYFRWLVVGCLLTTILIPSLAKAAPKFSRGTAIDGVIAYQDDSDPTQFWYIPTSVPLVLKKSLPDFGVKYWGVARAYRIKHNDGFYKSVVGATLQGRANIDITPELRARLIQEIKRAYGVANPKLLPMPLRNVKVTPVIAKGTLKLTDNQSDVIFQEPIAFGTDFNFIVGSGDNRLFTEYVATQGQNNGEVIADPSFAVNAVGEAEFVGDPWVNRCTADLNQVWHKTRTAINVSVGWGWFRLGSAQYNNITQELIKNHVINCDWKEGSLDTEKYGRQILELGKLVFEALNAKAASGEGFFKFEPNPEPAEINSGQSSGWWPWRVSINGGYSSAHSVQNAHWESTISYTGRFLWRVPVSMVLAVKCNSSTEALFTELGNSVPCINQEKADALNTRINAEAAAKNKRLVKALDRYLNGEITEEQYERILAALGRITITEDLVSPSAPALKDFSTAMKGKENPTFIGITDEYMDELETEIIRSHPRQPGKSSLERFTLPQRSKP